MRLSSSFVNSIINNVFKLKHLIELPKYYGSYYVSPMPPYISQFIGIYPPSITMETPLTNKEHIKKFGAKNSKEFTFWSWRDCGIACVQMILLARKKIKNKTMMDLTEEGISFGGYVLHEGGRFVDKGWFHKSIVKLLKAYGLNTRMKRWQSIDSVAKDILENKLVILSVFVPGRRSIDEDGSFSPKANPTFGGHLLLGIGVKMKGKDINGVYVHDPRGLEKYQKSLFIPRKVFIKIFTHRTIVVE
jgi:hypothetical protein